MFTETGIFGGEIQLAHAVGKACHRDQRPGELARDEVAADQADQQRAAACNDQKHQIERGILLDIGIWHIGEQAFLRVFIQRTGKAQILVVVPQLDVQELVFAGGERVPVEVLRNGLQDDIAAPLLLKQIKVGQLEGVLRAGAAVFRAVRCEERSIFYGAVRADHRQTDGRLALVVVQHGRNAFHTAVIAAADALVRIAQLVAAHHHIIVLIKEHVEQQEHADKDQRNCADRHKELEADRTAFHPHPSNR